MTYLSLANHLVPERLAVHCPGSDTEISEN